MSTNVTEEQRAYFQRKMRTRFVRLDLNKDGYISREDYEIMGERMAEIGGLKKEQAESLHKLLMTMADHLKLKPGEKTPIQKAVEIRVDYVLNTEHETIAQSEIHSTLFDLIDLNSDGHISPDELKVYFKVIAPEMSEADVVKTFETIDANKNGEISREEFLKAADDFFNGAEETELSNVFMGPLLD